MRLPRVVRLLLFAMLLSKPVLAADLTVERLTWAGVKLTSGETTVFIDAVGVDLWDGDAPEGLVPVTADTSRRYCARNCWCLSTTD